MASNTCPVIVVHGGAGSYERIRKLEVSDLLKEGVFDASKAGYKVLRDGGSAVDAVVSAVASLEDNECFNAGRGSHMTLNQNVEMDASVMDGATLKVGAVTCVKHVKNPVKLAKLVMEKSKSTLLDGEGAEKFCSNFPEERIELMAGDYFFTKYAKDRLKDHLSELKMGKTPTDLTMTNVQKNETSDTVGALALDCHGNLAYATSTGGLVGKEPGRVGDSPIVGCGGYADNDVCAVATTGVGEAIMKVCLAKHIHLLMEQGLGAEEATKKGVDYMKRKVGKYVGVITLAKSGEHAVYFNSDGMLWATIRNDTLSWGIYPGSNNSEKLA